MRAIRVQKRGNIRGLTMIHAIAADERTSCGLEPAELVVLEELELEAFPSDACGGCRRVLEPRSNRRGERLTELQHVTRYRGPISPLGRAMSGEQKTFHRIFPH